MPIAEGAIANGFSASAYDWNEQTVISYRGTNFTSATTTLPDVLNGWSMFTGFGTNSQASAAQVFFKAATGGEFIEGTTVIPNAIAVGHSLGGGLVGYVGARSVIDTFPVDPIPYGALTWQSVISDAFAATVEELELNGAGIGQLILEAVAGGTILGVSRAFVGAAPNRLPENDVSPQTRTGRFLLSSRTDRGPRCMRLRPRDRYRAASHGACPACHPQRIGTFGAAS